MPLIYIIIEAIIAALNLTIAVIGIKILIVFIAYRGILFVIGKVIDAVKRLWQTIRPVLKGVNEYGSSRSNTW